MKGCFGLCEGLLGTSLRRLQGVCRLNTDNLSEMENLVLYKHFNFVMMPALLMLTGGKAKNGAPIMTFPENPHQADISEGDYKKIVHYLSCIPPYVLL